MDIQPQRACPQFTKALLFLKKMLMKFLLVIWRSLKKQLALCFLVKQMKISLRQWFHFALTLDSVILQNQALYTNSILETSKVQKTLSNSGIKQLEEFFLV